MAHPLTRVLERAHLSYTEPHALRGTWTSPLRCLPDRAAADVQDAVTALAGPDAAARRTWTINASTCGAR